jgi:hypothetical protein
MTRAPLQVTRTRAIAQAFMDRHGAMLRNERFRVEGRVEEESAFVTATLYNTEGTLEYAMEAAMPIPERGGLTTEQCLDLCVDFLDWYLGEYFRGDREALLPLDYHPHRFGEHDVYARATLRNPTLEDAADAILRGDAPDELP